MSGASSVGPRTAPRPLWLVALALLPAAALLVLILRATGGLFVYTLDDPFIHLALARSLMQGHYCVQPGELCAPSSSVLWPFLLAPFSLLPPRLFELTPLAINLACLAASLALLLRLMPERLRGWSALLVTMLVAFGLNLYGLVFTGMEHSLQLLLVLLALDGFYARPVDGTPRPVRFYVALALLPLIRYEGLALSAALLGYQFVRGDRQHSLVAGGLALAGVIGFSLYLHGLGLGWLPASVIAKSTGDNGSWGILGRFVLAVVLHQTLAVGTLAVLLAVARGDRWLGTALAGLTVLHFAVGQFGWFGRYEVYWVTTIVVVALRLPGAGRLPAIALLLAVLLVGSDLRTATLLTPRQAEAVYAQQVQMDRIAHLLDEPVAVNDIGLITLHSRHYVLDVWGLSSRDALRLRRANPGSSAWLGPLLREKGVRQAMIYRNWYPQIPAGWTRVGSLVLTKGNVQLGGDTVDFYATDAASAARFRRALDAYRACCSTPLARLEPVSAAPVTR